MLFCGILSWDLVNNFLKEKSKEKHRNRSSVRPLVINHLMDCYKRLCSSDQYVDKKKKKMEKKRMKKNEKRVVMVVLMFEKFRYI